MAMLVKTAPKNYASTESQEKAQSQIFSFLTESLTCYEKSLGRDHPQTADAYSKIALAYVEAGQYDVASDWIRCAFKAFYGNFGE